MAYSRDTFRNPATGEVYAWHINHSDEQEFGKRRNINTGGNTGGTGLVLQQGDDDPMVIQLSGTILHHVQHEQFVRWFAICQTQSIYFTDFTGAPYEVIITEYSPMRQRTLRNPRDRDIPLHYWTYSLKMQVLTFLSGPWNQVTP